MYRQLSTLVIGMVLASAVHAETITDLEREMDRRAAKCHELYPVKDQRPVTPRVQCLNQVIIDISAKADRSDGLNHASLIRAHVAVRLAIADHYDRGDMTFADYEAEIARVGYESHAAFIQADQNAALVGAAQRQAIGAGLQGFANAYTRPRPVSPSVTCTTWGNTTTCR